MVAAPFISVVKALRGLHNYEGFVVVSENKW